MIRRTLYFSLWFAAAAAWPQPAIYVGGEPPALVLDAAYELQGFIHLTTGETAPIVRSDSMPEGATGAVLGTSDDLPAMAASWPFGLEIPAHDGYVLHDAGTPEAPLIAVAAPEALGVRQGVMALAERMGAGLSLGQTVFPIERRPFAKAAPAGVSESASPVFPRRAMGALHTHLMGAAAWDAADYRAYIDGLIRLRMTAFVVVAGVDTPFAAYPDAGAWHGGKPLPTTAEAEWSRPAMATSEFLGGTGAYFAGPHFGAPSRSSGDRGRAFAEAQGLLRDAFAYAARRGLATVLLVDVDGDPTAEPFQTAFAVQLAHLARTYPGLSELWLFGPERGACGDAVLDATAWREYADGWTAEFGEDDAMAGAQLALFAMQARAALSAYAPACRLGIGRPGGLSPVLIAGLESVLPDDTLLLGRDLTVHSLERDGDLWLPQPGLAEVREAVERARTAGIGGVAATHWRVKEPTLTAGYLAALLWTPDVSESAYIAERAPRFYPVSGADAAPWVEELSSLGYRWIGGAGSHERYPFVWAPGADDARARLARTALEIRQRIGEKQRIEAILPEEILLGWLPERLPGLRGALDLTLRPTRLLFGGRPTPPEGLVALYDRVAYAVAFDYAATRLAPGPAPLSTGGFESIPSWIGRSRLATAMHAYVREAGTKGELGVLASMNARAWGTIIEEYDVPAETVAALAAAPPNAFAEPAVRVLPGEIIVTGVGAAPYDVVVMARNAGGRRFLERHAPARGARHYEVAWPDGLAEEGLIEYGVEVRSRTFGVLRWPKGFPERWATAIRPVEAQAPQPTPAAADFDEPFAVDADADAERHRIRLSWTMAEGLRYRVLRNGASIAVTFAGHYIDRGAPAGVRMGYTVRAERVSDGETAAEAAVFIDTPSAPEPEPPSSIAVSSRGGRIVLTWTCDEPLASGYRIEQLDEDLRSAGETDLPALLGRRVSASFPTRSEGNAFRIRPIGLDASPGTRIRRFGVRPVEEEVPAVFAVDGDAPNVMEQLGVMTQRGFTIGGPGSALPPGVARWDRDNAFTVNLWLKLHHAEGEPYLICRGPVNDPDMAMYAASGRLHFKMSGLRTVCGPSIDLGVWRMATAVYDRGQIDLYLDGVLSAVGGEPSESRTEARDIDGLPAAVFETDGVIDRAAFYEAALTPQEIAAVYAAERGGVE